MHFNSHCLAAFWWAMLNDHELAGVCPTTSYPSAETFILKGKLTITFSEMNCPIVSRVLTHTMYLATLPASQKHGWTGKGHMTPRHIDNSHQPVRLLSFTRVSLHCAVSVTNFIFLYIKSLVDENVEQRPKFQLPKFRSSSGQGLKSVGAHILLPFHQD